MPSILQPGYDAMGRVTGYGGPQNEADRRSYYTTKKQEGPEVAVYDGVLKKYVSSKTGLNWTGPIVGNGGAVMAYANNGDYTAAPPSGVTAPGTTPPPLQVSSTVKTPEIASAALAGINQANQQRQQTLKDLTNFSQTASDILNRTYARSQGATDTTGTANALNTSLASQEGAQRALTGQAEARNVSYAQETQKLLDKMNAALTDEEAKSRAVGERAVNIALTQGNLIPLASGNADTITARSGAGTSRALNAVTNALLPVEQRIAQERRGVISSFETPLRQRLYQNDMALLDAKSTLERQFGGDRRSVIQYLQGLQQQAANMDAVSAEFYINQKLRLLGLPEQFLAGSVTNLAALGRLLQSAREDVVAEPFDPSLVPGAMSYGVSVPARSYQTGGGGGGGTFYPPTAGTGNNRLTDIYDAYSRTYRPTQLVAGAPVEPYRSSGGGGRLNDTWIGADEFRNYGYRGTDNLGQPVVLNPDVYPERVY